jgi:hypothetical protein
MSDEKFTGSDNVCIGKKAGPKMTTGSRCVLIGPEAGPHLTTANDCVGIGPRALEGVSTESGIVEINGVRSDLGRWYPLRLLVRLLSKIVRSSVTREVYKVVPRGSEMWKDDE